MQASQVGFSFASHWLRKRREFCKPITERSKAKTKANANYFRHLTTTLTIHIKNEKQQIHFHPVYKVSQKIAIYMYIIAEVEMLLCIASLCTNDFENDKRELKTTKKLKQKTIMAKDLFSGKYETSSKTGLETKIYYLIFLSFSGFVRDL